MPRPAPVQPFVSPSSDMVQPLTIVGGGITGLAAAYLAARTGAQVRVLEGSGQFGGLLNTFEVGGNRLERYYHHFFTHDAEINWLIHELGLTDQLQFRPTTMGFFREGRLYDFNRPLDLLGFSPLTLPQKLRWGLSSLFLGKFAQWPEYEHVSCLEWFYRYAGRGATEAIWRPMLEIKFGPYADQVPLAWMVGRLRQRLGSRQGGDERLGYLRGSLQTLLDALLNRLRKLGVELIPHARAEALDIQGGTLKGVRTTAGDFWGGHVLSTIPTVALAPLLQTQAPQLAKQLAQIEYFGAVCTILEVDRRLSHIYWLNVADSGFPFGGVIEHTNFIDPGAYEGKHLVYLSRYFAANDPLAKMAVSDIEEMMIPPLARIYPDFQASWIKNVHVFRTQTAATVCDLNFSQKVPACQTDIRHLYLANMAHIYPDERSTNNSIRIAAEACRVMGYDVPDVPARASLSGQIGFTVNSGHGSMIRKDSEHLSRNNGL